MLEPEPADRVQCFLPYTFRRWELLKLALTAPGADEANHDGNRSLARKGALAMELVLTQELEKRGLGWGWCLGDRKLIAANGVRRSYQ